MPEWAGEVRRRLSTVPLSPTREAEVVDELSQHLEEHYRELIAGGASAHEAERLTLAEFRSGNVLASYMATLRQAHPPLPITPGDPAPRLFHGLRQDLRYSVRMLRTHRAFTAAAVLTLALGIGVNAAIFALVDATLLRPLPLPAPERLVSVFEHTEQFPRGLVAPANLLDWNARAGSFERIAGHAPNVASMVLGSDAGAPETIPRQWVTSGIFDVLGVQPVVGRTFTDADDASSARVVVLNEPFWRTRFNADPGIVGQGIRLDGELWTVAQIYVPLAQDPTGDIFMLLRAASGQAESLAPAVRAAIARVDKAQLVSVRDVMTLDGIVAQGTARHRFRAVLVVVFAGLALVLAMVGLFGVLAYMVQQRVREFGVRRALGATTGDVLRQVGRAAVPMIASGAAVGLVLALLLARLIASMLFGVRPLDGVTYGAVAGVVMLTAAVAMAAPAWRATRVDPAIALRHE